MELYLAIHPKRYEEDPNLKDFLGAVNPISTSTRYITDLKKVQMNFTVMYLDLSLDFNEINDLLKRCDEEYIKKDMKSDLYNSKIYLITDKDIYQSLDKECIEAKIASYKYGETLLERLGFYVPKELRVILKEDFSDVHHALFMSGWVAWKRYNTRAARAQQERRQKEEELKSTKKGFFSKFNQ